MLTVIVLVIALVILLAVMTQVFPVHLVAGFVACILSDLFD